MVTYAKIRNGYGWWIVDSNDIWLVCLESEYEADMLLSRLNPQSQTNDDHTSTITRTHT